MISSCSLASLHNRGPLFVFFNRRAHGVDGYHVRLASNVESRPCMREVPGSSPSASIAVLSVSDFFASTLVLKTLNEIAVRTFYRVSSLVAECVPIGNRRIVRVVRFVLPSIIFSPTSHSNVVQTLLFGLSRPYP